MNKDEHLAKAVEGSLKRAMLALKSGQTPPVRSLPFNKADFPKLLCLDLNKWIDLARAHYGRTDGLSYVEALAATRAAVQRGTLVVGVAHSNVYEAAESADEARRERLARFMVDLSGNHSLVNGKEVFRAELRIAMARLWLGIELSPIRSSLLQRGMHAAVAGAAPEVATGSKVVDALVNAALYDEEMSVAALTHFTGHESTRKMRTLDAQTAEKLEQVRRIDAHLSLEERRALELANFFKTGSAADLLHEVLAESGLPADRFHEWLSDRTNLLAFARDVPDVHVISTLMLLRDLNATHRTHVNDGKDFSFLQLAIPYANIVVAEKSWVHFVHRSGLDKVYGTEVLTDAAELPTLLDRLGC